MIRNGIRRAFSLALRGKSRWERDVEDEIRLHLEFRAEQLMARGASVDDAYREAVRRFGALDESRARLFDAARHREQSMQRTEYLSDLRQDIGFALRTLTRQKSWTAVTIFTFALGIGASTAVFSVVSRLLLHPVDYPKANRVVTVAQEPSNGNNTGMRVIITPANGVFRAWRSGSHELEAMVGYGLGPMTLKTASEPASEATASVVPEFFSFAGAKPLAGRFFTQSDILSGEHVVVLSDAFWRERLAADQGAIGKRLTLNDALYTIVGVAPASLQLPDAGISPPVFWVPLDVRDDKGGLAVLGRLRPGATARSAEQELDALFAHMGGFTIGKIPFVAVVATPGAQLSFHDSLITLTAAVALVLLIACANVAHLLIARGASREREMAIRAALGAGRARLWRQLVTESLLVATLGSALGIVLAWLGLKLMVGVRPGSLDELAVARLDGTTLGVALAVTVVSGVVFGLIGTMQSGRHATNESLKTGAVGRAPRLRARIRGLIVVTEMALSAALLVGATMLVRSVVHMQRADLGFDPANLYQIYSPIPKTLRDSTATAARGAYLVDLEERLRRTRGVTGVSLAAVGPGSRNFSIGRLEIEGEPPPPAASTSFIDVNQVESSYFRVMNISIVRGLTFSDTTPTSTQVIVNRGFAAKHWSNADAIGKRIRIAQKRGKETWLTIAGVAADASTGGPASESTAPMLYYPSGVVPWAASTTVLLRTTGDTAALSGVRAVMAAAAQRRTPTISSIETRLHASLAAPRFVMLLLGLLTALALLLAGVGLYGVMSFVVAQQTREMGIRMALGATHWRVATDVMMRGVALSAAGAVIGLVLSRWGTRLIEEQLYGVTRSDATSFIVGAVVLIAAALLACAVPTRRALAVDPMTAIRAD